MFGKTTVSRLTTFYALYLDSVEQTALFEYRHEGLDQGFRTLLLEDVAIADGTIHHIAVEVFGDNFALFVDGGLHSRHQLIAALEDGPGETFLGQRQEDSDKYAGTVLWLGSHLSIILATVALVYSSQLFILLVPKVTALKRFTMY